MNGFESRVSLRAVAINFFADNKSQRASETDIKYEVAERQ